MSDQNTTAAETPNAGAGQQADSQQTETAQPFRTFKDQAELDAFMAKSKRQAERKALNAQAKELGYEDWEEMREALQPLRRAQTPDPTKLGNAQESQDSAPATPAAQSAADEAKRLRMALSVASELGLPATLIPRLQGETPEEMAKDAQQLLGLFQQPAKGPGIPAAPKTNQVVTFTRTQLQDAKFVRANKDAIMLAAREGRIVD